jgi:DNA-binding GntR family transcriptional regulator
MESVVRGSVCAQPLQEKVYTRLKENIVNCEMLPGAVICEDVLAEKFGTSRTPIREALLRLQREGLVTIFPRQGTFVSQISRKDIYEIYQIRLIIEPKVARISCPNLNPETLTRFRDLFIRLETTECSYADWFRYDRDLHWYIVDSSGNRHLRQMYGTIIDQNLRMRILAGRLPMRMRETNQEHVAILDALLTQDADRVEEVVASHIIASRNTALRIEGFIHEQEPRH